MAMSCLSQSWVVVGVMEVTVAMMELKKRQHEAAQDAVALRRRLRASTGKGITLPSGVQPLTPFSLISEHYVQGRPVIYIKVRGKFSFPCQTMSKKPDERMASWRVRWSPAHTCNLKKPSLHHSPVSAHVGPIQITWAFFKYIEPCPHNLRPLQKGNGSFAVEAREAEMGAADYNVTDQAEFVSNTRWARWASKSSAAQIGCSSGKHRSIDMVQDFSQCKYFGVLTSISYKTPASTQAFLSCLTSGRWIYGRFEKSCLITNKIKSCCIPHITLVDIDCWS